MKSKRFKKVISSVVSLFLIMVIVFSLSSSCVLAQGDIFTGIEAIEVKENQTVDLLQGVYAVAPTGESLPVTVTNVICETDGGYQYDGSGTLNVGLAGNVYQVEYQAALPEDAETVYLASKEITVIPSEDIFVEESTEDILGDSTEEFTDENAEEFADENVEEISGNEANELTDGSVEEFSDGTDIAAGDGTQILFENGIHYIIDPAYPDQKIPLFCMNNKLHWPHHTEGMGETQVPGYTEGYLTPNDFESEEAYNECMRRLSKLLYAGYPYNGERLYQIVENSEEYAPTEEQFNDMLIVPPVLQTAFPYLGHHAFTYADWTSQNKQHLEELRIFVNEVFKLFQSHGTTSNGLTYADIEAMPFYRAAFSIVNCNNQTPLEAFQFFYGAAYFVTEEEAYNATQNAVWRLLYEYGIPDNDIDVLHTPLSNVLYTYSERGGLLDYRPSSSEIEVSGDLSFTYNPKDGLWHSGALRIIEPDVYRGLYRLNLPTGVTALCDNLNYVYGNEEYELVSDHQPGLGESFGIEAEFVWLEEFKQYSPTPDIEFEGKKFQHMIGAIIHKESVYLNEPMTARDVGNVAITKRVVGETNSQTEFQFEFKLPDHPELNGLYGDLEFHNGVATFTLKDGETKTAENLPSGAYYVVTESRTQGYQTGSINAEGTVLISDIQNVIFTNTKLLELSLSKTVTGELGDKTKQFHFKIQLKDSEGAPVSGNYSYIGGVKEGVGTGIQKPEDGTLTFRNGEASIALSHGQQITIRELPFQTSYTITEEEANQDHYTTTYNGKQENATGTLDTNASVEVENNREFVPPTGITENHNHSAGVMVMLSLSTITLFMAGSFFYRRKGLKK